jgi:LmbE family N-acetylglucosaminyl deacetylase/glycosyltransferase involved in cell wall biosynthesis
LENLLIPYQAAGNITANRVLVLAPHPDDEVFGCGGAIMRHIEQHVPVHVIIVTDGAYGVNPDETAEYTRQRRNESIAAAAILGYGTPAFWQQPDRGLYYGEKLIGEISAAIHDTQTDLIYAPSVYEIHPDHRALGMAALEAVRRCSNNPVQLALYEIGQPFQPNLLLDISDLAARKMEAMRCFASQNARQRYDLDIAALNRYRTYTLPDEVSAAEAYILTSTETLVSDPLKLYQSEHARQQAKGLPTDTRDLPLVSVIIRSMDRDTLSDALDSVALQTYPNIEVVLVNAKGQRHRAVGEWCGRFPLRMTTNNEPLSRSKAANAGLDAAQGKYLIFLDDDDFFLPTHIAGLKTELEKTESLAAVYSSVKCVNQSGTEIRQFNEFFDPILFRTENFIPIHAVLFRRSTVESGVRFDETLTLCEDWDFWLQMLEYGQFRLFPETTAIYRMELSQSGVWENAALSQKMMTIIYRKWFLRWPDNILWRIMEYARCKNIINQRDRQIHTMNLTIHEHDKTIQQNGEAIRALNETIQERDTLITMRNQQIADILASTSWKVTKPLRALKQFMEKIRR